MKVKVFPNSSIFCFAWVSKTCLCSSAEPWRGGDPSSPDLSGTREGRIPHPLSFRRPSLRGRPGPNSDVEASPAMAARWSGTTRSPCPCGVVPFSSGKCLSSSPLRNVWRQGCLPPLRLSETVFPTKKGKLLRFSVFPSPHCRGLLGRVEENSTAENEEESCGAHRTTSLNS